MDIISSPREIPNESKKAPNQPGKADTSGGARRHFAFLDGLRGWASVAVVFYHVQFVRTELAELGAALPSILVDDIFGRGNIGVAVFFVLSGFVIAYSVRGSLALPAVVDLRAGPRVDGGDARLAVDRGDAPLAVGPTRPFSARVFAVRRLLRIVPPYYLAIVLALAFAFAAAVQSGQPFAPGEAVFTWPRFGAHLFFGQEILGFTNFNDVFWTLGLELQFYGVFAVLVAIQRWLGAEVRGVSTLPVVFGVAGLASVACTLTMAPGAARAVWFPALMFSFLLGVVMVLRALRLLAWWLPALMLIAVAAVAALHTYNREFALASAATAAVLWLVVEVGGLERVLADPVSQFLGRVSYSLYLIHTPVLGAALVVSALLLPQSVAGQAVGLVLGLVASIVAAAIMYYLIERPSVRWSRRFGASLQSRR